MLGRLGRGPVIYIVGYRSRVYPLAERCACEVAGTHSHAVEHSCSTAGATERLPGMFRQHNYCTVSCHGSQPSRSTVLLSHSLTANRDWRRPGPLGLADIDLQRDCATDNRESSTIGNSPAGLFSCCRWERCHGAMWSISALRCTHTGMGVVSSAYSQSRTFIRLSSRGAEVLMLAAPASSWHDSPRSAHAEQRPVLSVLADLDRDCSGSALSV